MDARAWSLVLSAALLMALSSGHRMTLGLFVSPLNAASGLGLAWLSLVLALAQVAVGLAQPAIGRLADRVGAARVVLVGALLLAPATALPAWSTSAGIVSLSLIAMAVASSAVGSNGLLMGEVNRAVPTARAGLAVGIVGAGASVGQLLLGPLTQLAIDHAGWRWALVLLGGFSLLALPLARPLRRSHGAAAQAQAALPLGPVLRDGRYWLVALSFGVCGFHVGFLSVHMPGVIERCGLPASLAGTWIAVAGLANVAGSLVMGAAMKRHNHATLLTLTYGLRAAGIAPLLAATPTAQGMLMFAAAMGATHMATLPPTVQLVLQRCGVQRLGTLFGVVMLVHQLGSFAGVWLGGWAAALTGSDRLLWWADIALALTAAALVQLGSGRHPRLFRGACDAHRVGSNVLESGQR